MDCEKVTFWPFEWEACEAASAHTSTSSPLNLIESRDDILRAITTRVFIAPIYIDPINSDIVIFVPILA